MKEKVIFDTNITRNAGVNTFLGNREILFKFSQDAEIILPDVVVQEIKSQKRRDLKNKRDKFLKNPFHKLIGVNEDETNAFSIEDYIQKLIDEEDIPFKVIDLKDNNVLSQIKDLAINKQAPFESKDKTDKGFKPK